MHGGSEGGSVELELRLSENNSMPWGFTSLGPRRPVIPLGSSEPAVGQQEGSGVELWINRTAPYAHIGSRQLKFPP
eukprot:6081011-Pyramimonas_sp.AAC.1